MIQLYLIRHGRTIENEQGISQGHSLGTLSETGHTQIAHLAEHFKKIPIDTIISSDLERCKITAQAVEKVTGAPLLLNSLLRERSNGKWEGKFYHELEHTTENTDFASRQAPNGESWNDVAKRARTFLQELDQYDGKTLALISHGGFIRTLIGQLIGISVENSIKNLRTDNCGISIIEYTPEKSSLLLFNHTDHLP